MPFEEYRALPGWNAHTAVNALDSLALVKDVRDGLADSAETPAMQEGSLAHMAILEPERFEMCVRTTGPINPRTGDPYGRDTKAFADWQASHPDWVAVPPWLGRAIQRMPGEVRELLSGPGMPEVVAQATVGGLPVKCRCDRLNPGLIVELKTINDIRNMERDVAKRMYWFNAAWYRMVLKASENRAHQHVHVFVEKRLPHRWRILDPDADLTMYADDRVEHVLGLLMGAVSSGDWTDKAEIRTMMGRPAFLDHDDDDTENNP